MPRKPKELQSLTPHQAAFVLEKAIAEKKVSRKDVDRYLAQLPEELAAVQSRLASLRGIAIDPQDGFFGEQATLAGTLDINGQESRINGTLLALCSSSTPISDATGFVKQLGFRDGSRILARGTHATIGMAHVFCITGASR